MTKDAEPVANPGDRSRGAGAQWTQTFQVLPEIDAYYRFNPNFRIYVQAKDTREVNRIRRKSDQVSTFISRA